LIAITVINSGTIAWYFLFAQVNLEFVFGHFTRQQNWIYIASALYYSFSAISAIIGTALRGKIDRRKILEAWIIIGILATVFLLFYQSEQLILVLSPLLGTSFGFGLPFSLSLLGDFVTIKNRARASGIILFQAFLMIFAAMIIIEIFNLGLIGTIIILILLRSSGFITLALEKCNTTRVYLDDENWKSILIWKEFVYYFSAWLMFIIAIVLTDHILWATIQPTPAFQVAFEIGGPLHYVATALVSLISGIIADRAGRKIPIYIGLVMLGSSFAILGINVTPEIVFIHLMTIGIAFGLIWPIYISVPGDMGEKAGLVTEKLYALIVVLPLAVYGGLGAIPRIFDVSAPVSTLSPILSIILFISIFPVIFSKEVVDMSKEERLKKIKAHIKKISELVEENGKSKG